MLDHGYVKLRTAYNAYEKGLFQALLEQEGISFKVRSRGAGDYLRVLAGGSLMADDYYVKEEDWERAKTLLEGFILTGSEEDAVTVIDEEDARGDVLKEHEQNEADEQ